MNDSASPLVNLERRDDGVAVIRLQNPKVNAISSEVLRQIVGLVESLQADLPGAVVVTGGDRIFAAGADITEFKGPDEARSIGALFLEAGNALAVVSAQQDASLPAAAPLAVAYEPIWAIGTGRIPSLEDIAAMHAALRGRLIAAYGDAGRGVRLLYGGSVKPGNAAAIFALADVDGALVGGASLSAADFLPIVEAARPA